MQRRVIPVAHRGQAVVNEPFRLTAEGAFWKRTKFPDFRT